jgi:hypothetical protein
VPGQQEKKCFVLLDKTVAISQVVQKYDRNKQEKVV